MRTIEFISSMVHQTLQACSNLSKSAKFLEMTFKAFSVLSNIDRLKSEIKENTWKKITQKTY